jgi:hypothetical protein
MTAAAFAKGLLALEGELTPILVQVSNIFVSCNVISLTRASSCGLVVMAEDS